MTPVHFYHISPQRGPCPSFFLPFAVPDFIGGLRGARRPCGAMYRGQPLPPPCMNPQSTPPSESRTTVLAGMGCFWWCCTGGLGSPTGRFWQGKGGRIFDGQHSRQWPDPTSMPTTHPDSPQLQLVAIPSLHLMGASRGYADRQIAC